MVMALSNGYGQSSSNLKVLQSVPSLRLLRAFFISSHLEFIGEGVTTPDPGAPSIGQVLELGFCWPYGVYEEAFCTIGVVDAMGY